MAKKKKTSNSEALSKSDILKPFDIQKIGTIDDPCWGKAFDLSTKECRICSDSEICAIMMAQNLGKTRKQLEKENNYKDLDVLYDKEAIFKYIKQEQKKGKVKKEIIQGIQSKYETTLQETRSIYREYINQ